MNKIAIFDLIRQAFQFFWPYFITTLLAGLLVLGGMVLLVIPGLLVSFLFSFISYEVVIGGKSRTVALKRSYIMIKYNFWEILGRLLFLEAAIVIVAITLQKIASIISIVGIVSFAFSLFASWYVRSYLILLYKEVRGKTTFPQTI